MAQDFNFDSATSGRGRSVLAFLFIRQLDLFDDAMEIGAGREAAGGNVATSGF